MTVSRSAELTRWLIRPAFNALCSLGDPHTVFNLRVTNSTYGVKSVTMTLYTPNGGAISTAAASGSFGLLQWLPVTGTYAVLFWPDLPATGSLTFTPTAVATSTPPPSRPVASYLDPTNALATNLAGLFVMNEATGTTDENLVNGGVATFVGAPSTPTWSLTDPPAVAMNGTSSSYLSAGADIIFDQLQNHQFTVVTKVFVNAVAAAGLCEKSDDDLSRGNSGFFVGWGIDGTLKLIVQKTTGAMSVTSAAGWIEAGHWVQIAFTFDGTLGSAADAHVFLSGVEQPKVSSINGSGTIGYANSTNQPLLIGSALRDVMAGALNGRMAYFAVYKGRILTSTEMNQLDPALPIAHADVITTVTTNGTGAPVTTTAAGQKIRFRFNANQAQVAVVQLTSNTLGSVTASLMTTDHTVVSSVASSASSFSIPRVWLPATAAYMVYVEPGSSATGSITAAVAVSDRCTMAPSNQRWRTARAGALHEIFQYGRCTC